MKYVMLLIGLSVAYANAAHAEFSDWCADRSAYQIKIGERRWNVRVGDGGRVCDDDQPINLRPVTRFSATGGLTGISSYYAFFGGRVRLRLRHVRLRCTNQMECTSPRAGERCGILNAEGNVWPGVEGFFREPKPEGTPPAELRLAFERVAWNALLGVDTARELVRDQTKWADFGLTKAERDDLADDLDFSRRHCDEIAGDPGGDVLTGGRVGVIEGDRIVPLAELYDGHWNVTETAFHSLYRKFDGGAREAWGLRTRAPSPLVTRWRTPNADGARATELTLTLPTFLTSDEVIERRGFFTGVVPPAGAPGVRVISSLDGTKDPERWQPDKPTPALIKRAREAFRTDHARRFECLPRADDDDAETLSLVSEPFADRELDVFRGFRAKNGDALVGVRAMGRCRQPVFSEIGLPTVLQRHWYFLPKTGSARLVTRAKDALLAADFDGDGTSEWIFTSAGVDERPPYYYALFARPRGEVIESH